MSSISIRHVLLTAALLSPSACAEVDEPDLDTAAEEISNGDVAPAGFFREVGRVLPELCTGTLIGPRTVLTAAHCIDESTLASLRVQLDGQTYSVVRATSNAAYPGSVEHDLAVLVLDRVAPLAPVRINHDNVLSAGEEVVLVGFGRTHAQVNDGGVKRWGTNAIESIYALTLTIAGASGDDSLICPGDSGGPSFREGRQVGVHRAISAGECQWGTGYLVRLWPFASSIEDRSVYPYVDTSGMVSQQYRDFLGREPDGSGRLHWMGRLHRGELEPEGVVANFLRSPEFAGTSAPIIRLYLAALGRLPDSGGFYYWLGLHRGGTSIASIADQLSGTQEFRNRYGALSNAAFVSRAYQDTLGRAADAAGHDYWTQRLNAGTVTRGGVVNGLAQSAEAAARFTIDVDVSMVYLGMLRRSPDSAGFNHWKSEMQAGRLGLDALIGIVFHGHEYAVRFGGS